MHELIGNVSKIEDLEKKEQGMTSGATVEAIRQRFASPSVYGDGSGIEGCYCMGGERY